MDSLLIQSRVPSAGLIAANSAAARGWYVHMLQVGVDVTRRLRQPALDTSTRCKFNGETKVDLPAISSVSMADYPIICLHVVCVDTAQGLQITVTIF